MKILNVPKPPILPALILGGLLTGACGGDDSGGGDGGVGTTGSTSSGADVGVDGGPAPVSSEGDSGGDVTGDESGDGPAPGDSGDSGDSDDSSSGDGPAPGCAAGGPLFTALTDPSCSDGQYCETLPDLEADISEHLATVQAMSSPAEATAAATEMFETAWPFGAAIFAGASPGCAEEWMAYDYGWQNQLGLAVHECGHNWDQLDAWNISEDYSISMGPDDFYERWEITQDMYHDTIPNAAANDTYFDQGAVTSDQGIWTMYDEWTQYVHSVALDYLLYADAPRDFYVAYMLNFAWAAPRYFLWAEANHPADFAAMMASPDIREATLVLWGQTLLYYDAMAADTAFVPEAEQTQYIDAMQHPDLLDMINRIRLEHGCDGL